MRGNVELSGAHGILAEADLDTIEPDIVRGLDSLKAEEVLPASPVSGHDKLATVAPDRIVVLGHKGRVDREGVRDVHVPEANGSWSLDQR